MAGLLLNDAGRVGKVVIRESAGVRAEQKARMCSEATKEAFVTYV